MDKKTVLSGIQPSGSLTLGNYIGALKNFPKLQDDYDCYYCIVDLHAITVPQEPRLLRKNTLEVLALYLACGIDPDKSTIFIQSHVHEHAELAWVLNTITYMGQLNRMTQYKDKSKKYNESINAGLFTYPVLMAADILLYQADLVPVGEDQRQHLELARDIAIRFNNKYSETFNVPEPFIGDLGSKIMSLQDPTVKMSKSDQDENAFISLLDDKDTIRRKIKRAVTDSANNIAYNDSQLGLKNLINIYSCLTDKKVDEIVGMYQNRGYGKFKEDLAEIVIESLLPIQKKYNEYMSDKTYLEDIYSLGASKAERKASKTLKKVYKKIGFVAKK
jgi:tryptophanyl-tRNA synthetase